MNKNDKVSMVISKPDEYLDPDCKFDWIWAVKLSRGVKAWGIACGVKDDAGADEAEEFWDLACEALSKAANSDECRYCGRPLKDDVELLYGVCSSSCAKYEDRMRWRSLVK